jgi:hypothetical protein
LGYLSELDFLNINKNKEATKTKKSDVLSPSPTYQRERKTIQANHNQNACFGDSTFHSAAHAPLH